MLFTHIMRQNRGASFYGMLLRCRTQGEITEGLAKRGYKALMIKGRPGAWQVRVKKRRGLALHRRDIRLSVYYPLCPVVREPLPQQRNTLPVAADASKRSLGLMGGVLGLLQAFVGNLFNAGKENNTKKCANITNDMYTNAFQLNKMVNKLLTYGAALGLGAAALSAPKVEGASVITQNDQNLGLTTSTQYITNNDNAIFNSGIIDFNTTYGGLLDAIRTQNSNYLGLSRSDIVQDMVNEGDIAIRGPPTGEIETGWSWTYDGGTGTIALNHNNGIPGLDRTVWNDSELSNTFAISYNFDDRADLNNNGITDANELLTENGTLTNGFIGYDGGIGFGGDTQKYNVASTSIPEPSTTALAALGGLALILRRKR